MKARTLILFVIVAFLLLGSMALRQARDSALAQSSVPPPPTRYTVGKGVLSGGHYRLTGPTWRVRGTVGGGVYRLLEPATPASSENGCCCTYLPCVLRNY
jgi:hypothetical protein